MTRHCIVTDCNTDSRYHPGARFFKFPRCPKKVEIRKQWILNVNREGKDGKLWQPKTDDSVCHKHFVDEEPTTIHPVPELNMGHMFVTKVVGRRTINKRNSSSTSQPKARPKGKENRPCLKSVQLPQVHQLVNRQLTQTLTPLNEPIPPPPLAVLPQGVNHLELQHRQPTHKKCTVPVVLLPVKHSNQLPTAVPSAIHPVLGPQVQLQEQMQPEQHQLALNLVSDVDLSSDTDPELISDTECVPCSSNNYSGHVQADPDTNAGSTEQQIQTTSNDNADAQTWLKTSLSFHSYSKRKNNCATDEQISKRMKSLEEELQKTKVLLNSQSRRFSHKVLEGNDKRTRQFTGFPSYKCFITMFERRVKPKAKLLTTNHKAGRIHWHKSTFHKKPGRARALELVDEFLLVMMRLRKNPTISDLAERFSISDYQVSRIIARWFPLLVRCFRKYLKKPSKELVQKHMPKSFKKEYSNTRVIIDCFEVFIERPTILLGRQQTWSTYKHHNTAKVLVGVSPEGGVTFLSQAWGGRTSDKHIVKHSGFLEIMEPYDEVMADRGFNVAAELAERCCRLNMPPFTGGKSQLSRGEVERHRKISHLRIHVERAIERIKKFRILKGAFPLNQIHHFNDIVTICSAVVNMWKPIVVDPLESNQDDSLI